MSLFELSNTVKTNEKLPNARRRKARDIQLEEVNVELPYRTQAGLGLAKAKATATATAARKISSQAHNSAQAILKE